MNHALWVAAIEEARLAVAEDANRYFTDAELGRAWKDEIASRAAELADRKRDLLAAQSEIYVSEAERALKIDRIESSIGVTQSDLIALGLVLERARKVTA